MKIEKQVSVLSGEVAVLTPSEVQGYDIPFSTGFNLEALKLVDDDPFFATVRIRSGKGDQGAGPNYGDDILRSIEEQINTKRPPGYKGHQDPERISWEYREPVTAWVGAKFVAGPEGQGELIVKGYVPPTAQDLRTQLKLAESGADVVNSVSIFGTRDVDGDQVTRFDLWSLDWTPKGRNGMQTELMAVSGEQTKEEDVTREEVIASLKPEDVPEHLVKGFQQEALSDVAGETALAGEIRVVLELEEADSKEVMDALRGLVSEKNTADLEGRIDEILEDQVTVEMAQSAVKDAILPKLSVKSTDEEITGEISEALKRPYIEALTQGSVIPVFSGGPGKERQTEARQGTVWE